MGLLVKNILRHPSGRISYRRVFPPTLRPWLPGREFKVSLGAEGSDGFLSRYEDASRQYEDLVSRARKQQARAYDPLNSATIAYLAEAWRVESLEADETARWSLDERTLYRDLANTLRVAEGFSSPWRTMQPKRWAAKKRETLERMIPVYRDLKADGDLPGIVNLWREEALEFAQARGLLGNPEAEEEIAQLCRALNDAALSAGEDKLRRLDGEEVPTPEEPDRPEKEAAPATGRRNAVKVPLLQTFDAYAAAQEMTPGVRDEWRNYIRHLTAFLEHDDAGRITADDLRRWRDALLSEPTKLGRSGVPSP